MNRFYGSCFKQSRIIKEWRGNRSRNPGDPVIYWTTLQVAPNEITFVTYGTTAVPRRRFEIETESSAFSENNWTLWTVFLRQVIVHTPNSLLEKGNFMWWHVNVMVSTVLNLLHLVPVESHLPKYYIVTNCYKCEKLEYKELLSTVWFC